MGRTVYADRRHGGRVLAGLLAGHSTGDTVVLALARGGVPVGFEVATSLRVPLDVFCVRKLGVPRHGELALGAIANGVRALNDDVIEAVGATPEMVERISRVETEELARREELYRRGRPAIAVAGRNVILVDDGVATGSTMRAAVESLRARAPARIVTAAPTGSVRGCEALLDVADDVVCGSTPEPFVAVALSYRFYGQTTDAEVTALLAQPTGPPGTPRPG